MNNNEMIRGLIKSFSGMDRIITIPKIYIELTGDLNTAAFLNQVVFWSDKTSRKDGYFYKTYADWESELCLSKYQIGNCVKRLKALEIITTKVMKANGTPTVHYKLDYEVLQQWIVKKLNFQKSINQTSESEEAEFPSITEEYNRRIQQKNKEQATDSFSFEDAQKNKEQATDSFSFEDAWSHYPKKTLKPDAEAAYKAAIKKGVKHEDIVSGIEAYKKMLAENTWQNPMDGGRWFKKGRWADDYELKMPIIEPEKTEEEKLLDELSRKRLEGVEIGSDDDFF